MTKLNQIYKCSICGNIVEMLHTGAGTLVCCGQPMDLQVEKTQDDGKASSAEAMAVEEKHTPVIEQLVLNQVEGTEKGIKVKVGSIPHPMTSEHYIEWIEILFNGKTGKKFLNPTDTAEAEFEFQNPPKNITARAYCNIHDLWKSTN